MSKEECPRDVTGNRKYFHPDMKVCVPLDMVPQERGGTMPKCEGREDGNYFDDLGRCSQFTVCASGAIAEIIKCKEGEVYDPFPQKCVEEAEACEPCGKMNIWYVFYHYLLCIQSILKCRQLLKRLCLTDEVVSFA